MGPATAATVKSNGSPTKPGEKQTEKATVESESGAPLATGHGPEASDARGSKLSMCCWFECGATCNDHKLINIGTARCLKMVCGPCYSAKRAVDSQGRATEENKRALADLKIPAG